MPESTRHWREMRVASGRSPTPFIQLTEPRKLATKARARLEVDLARRADLLNAALVHDGDLVGDGKRLLLVVGHHQKGDADAPLQAFNCRCAPACAAWGRATRAARRAAARRARAPANAPAPCAAFRRPKSAPGNALLASKLHQFERLADAAVAVADALLPQPEFDVLPNRQVRKEGEVLEDGADLALVRFAVARPARRAGRSPRNMGARNRPPAAGSLSCRSPKAPSSAKNDPLGTERQTPSSTRCSPKLFPTSRNSRIESIWEQCYRTLKPQPANVIAPASIRAVRSPPRPSGSWLRHAPLLELEGTLRAEPCVARLSGRARR
jgi:hypothetical protein